MIRNFAYSLPPTFLSASLPLATDLNITTHSGMHWIALGTKDDASHLHYLEGHDNMLSTIASFVGKDE